MSKKKNNINVENVSGTSQYDGMQVLKDVHSLPGHYLRTRESLTLVQTYYDSFSVTYDDNKNPIKIEYFAGTSPHTTEIGFVGDSAGSLAGTYFIISGGRKSIRYVIWYSVDGSGTEPDIPDTVNVEVAISENDEAAVVAFATQLALEKLNGDVFDISRVVAVLTVKTLELGETNNTINNGTGFTITNTAGTSQLVDTVKLNYTSEDDPIWQGQTMMGYRYNIYTGRFEISSNVSDVGDEVTDDTNVALTKAIQTGKNPDGTYDNLRASGHASSNSTTTPLLAGESYVGEWEDIQGYSHIAVLIKSDVNSALEGASAEFSVDGVNVVRQITTTFIGNPNGAFFTIPVEARYFRINYTNGNQDQGNFTVETILSVNPIGLSTIPVAATVDDLTSTLIVRAVQTGKGPNGDYFNERLSGVVDALSTTDILGANETYTSPWYDVSSYSTGSIILNTDVDSAPNGLKFELSTNGINVDERDEYSFPSIGAGQTGKVYSVPLYANFFRIVYDNGPDPQTEFRLQVKLFKESLKFSSHRIDDAVLSQDDAELVKSVQSGESPNGVFTNIRSQGIHDGNSTSIPLDANEIYRGEWFQWQESYVALTSDLTTDTSGIFYIDFSQAANPVNGSDVSVDDSIAVNYDPSELPLFRRKTPLQSAWVRHRYINGNAAQSRFELRGAFLTNDPGTPVQELATLPTANNEAGVSRTIPAIPSPQGNGAYQEIPVTQNTGLPQQSVEEIHDDIAIKPIDTVDVNQVVVGSTNPTRLDIDPLPFRRTVSIKNNGPGEAAYGHSSNMSFNSNSDRISEGERISIALSENVPIYALAQDIGGVETTLDRSGSSASGTATDPSNVLASDNSRAIMDANGETIEVSGFTAGTTNDIVSVRLGMEARKEAGQTEQATFVDVVSGTAGNTGSVTSGIVAANSDDFYLVEVAWVNDNASITDINGLGLTWTVVGTQAGNNAKVAVYRGIGTPTQNSTVTVSFSQTSGGSAIGVSRFSGVDLSSPINTIETLTGSGSSYADSIDGPAGGNLVVSANVGNRTHTAGSGSTEQLELASGNATLVHTTKELNITTNHSYSGTLSGSTVWTLVAVTLNPSAADDPKVDLSYEYNNVVGDSNGVLTFPSTTDVLKYVDITGDRMWAAADIANVDVIAESTLIGAANLEIDHIFIEIVDTTGNTARFSIWQGAREVL